MTLKKKSNVVSMFSKEDVQKMAEEYNSLSLQIKQLDEKKKELADKLKDCAEKLGVKDDKGSYYIDGENFVVGKVAKNSLNIDTDKGVEVLKEKGLTDCYKEVKTYKINESKVEEALNNGDLTDEEVDSFTSLNTTYMISVKEKEEMPEVEQSAVASTKKKRK